MPEGIPFCLQTYHILKIHDTLDWYFLNAENVSAMFMLCTCLSLIRLSQLKLPVLVGQQWLNIPFYLVQPDYTSFLTISKRMESHIL